VLFTLPFVILHLPVKIPFPEARPNQALMKALPLHSRSTEPPDSERGSGLCGSPHRTSIKEARASADPSHGGLGTRRQPSSEPGRVPQGDAADHSTAGLKALALLPCSQLLPQMSRLYYGDELGRLQQQLEVGSRSQPSWLQAMTVLKEEA